VPTLSFAPGFPAADFPDCGATVFAYGETQADADAAADNIAALIESHENDFDGRIYTPDEGVRHAMELATRASKPIVIAIRRTIPAPAAIPTPQACCARWSERCHQGRDWRDRRSGVRESRSRGGDKARPSGSRSAASPEFPATRRSRQHLSSSNFPTASSSRPDRYFGGSRMNLGPSAALRIGGVRLVVGSPQGAARGSGDVPLCRHRADRAIHPGQ